MQNIKLRFTEHVLCLHLAHLAFMHIFGQCGQCVMKYSEELPFWVLIRCQERLTCRSTAGTATASFRLLRKLNILLGACCSPAEAACSAAAVG